MGIIQSAVNQALGTVGTVAGIGKVIKTGQESLDLQKKAEAEATAEREKKKAYAAQLEEEVSKDPSLQPTTVMNQVGEDEFEAEETVEPSARGIYLQNQLAKVYEESGEFGKAYDIREKAKSNQYILDLIARQRQANTQAQTKKDIEAEQATQSQEYQQNFIESVAELKDINMRKKINVFDRDEEAMI
jgi:hypothetical protein